MSMMSRNDETTPIAIGPSEELSPAVDGDQPITVETGGEVASAGNVTFATAADKPNTGIGIGDRTEKSRLPDADDPLTPAEQEWRDAARQTSDNDEPLSEAEKAQILRSLAATKATELLTQGRTRSVIVATSMGIKASEIILLAEWLHSGTSLINGARN